MIIATVGTQLPFDRLILMLDEIAASLPEKIFAQIGKSRCVPKNIEWCVNMDAGEFEKRLAAASVIVSHAGIGTVLKAYKYAKPIILVPRKASFGEHRNDHQLATVSQLERRAGIYIAHEGEQLAQLLSRKLEPAVAAEDTFRERVRLQRFVADYVGEALGNPQARQH